MGILNLEKRRPGGMKRHLVVVAFSGTYWFQIKEGRSWWKIRGWLAWKLSIASMK